MKTKILILAAVMLAAFQMSFAQVIIPKFITYQGVLFLEGGKPATTGNYNLTFRIYDSRTGGNIVWDDNTFTSTPIEDGLFTVDLGSKKPLNIAFDKPYWLELSVEVPGGTFTPNERIRFTSAPFAFRADTANVAKTVVGGIIPVGSIMAWAMPTPPEGWLMCDGKAITSAQYPELFTVLGTAYGTGGGGAGGFNLPNYSGMFLRGAGSSASDPGFTGRSGGTGALKVGSTQEDAFARHNHTGSTGKPEPQATPGFLEYNGLPGPDRGLMRTEPTQADSDYSDHTHTIPDDGGDETRPKNIYVVYIIKAK